MNKKANSLYQLKKSVAEIQNPSYKEEDKESIEKNAKTFIDLVANAFAEKKYFKCLNKDQYNYTIDFILLVHALAKLNNTDTFIHSRLLQCKRCSISFKDMGHLFYLLLNNENGFSPSFINRIYQVLPVLHFLIYNSKNLTYTTDKKTIKKKLLFYLVAKNSDDNFKITEKLTLSEFLNTISGNMPCEI